MIFEIDGELFHSTKLHRLTGRLGTSVYVTRDYSRAFVRKDEAYGGFKVHEATPDEIHRLITVEGLDELRRVQRQGS